MRNVLLSIFIFLIFNSASAVSDSNAAIISKAKQLLLAQARESVNPAHLDRLVDAIIKSITLHDNTDCLLKYVNNESQISADYSLDNRGHLYITISFLSGLKGLNIKYTKQQQ